MIAKLFFTLMVVAGFNLQAMEEETSIELQRVPTRNHHNISYERCILMIYEKGIEAGEGQGVYHGVQKALEESSLSPEEKQKFIVLSYPSLQIAPMVPELDYSSYLKSTTLYSSLEQRSDSRFIKELSQVKGYIGSIGAGAAMAQLADQKVARGMGLGILGYGGGILTEKMMEYLLEPVVPSQQTVKCLANGIPLGVSLILLGKTSDPSITTPVFGYLIGRSVDGVVKLVTWGLRSLLSERDTSLNLIQQERVNERTNELKKTFENGYQAGYNKTYTRAYKQACKELKGS